MTQKYVNPIDQLLIIKSTLPHEHIDDSSHES